MPERVVTAEVTFTVEARFTAEAHVIKSIGASAANAEAGSVGILTALVPPTDPPQAAPELPLTAERFLEFLIAPDRLAELKSFLQDSYQQEAKRGGELKARRWFRQAVVRSTLAIVWQRIVEFASVVAVAIKLW